MVDSWVRSIRVGTTPSGTGYYGSQIMLTVDPGETLLKSWVSWGGWTIRSGGDYPPGGSLLRVGLAWQPFLEPNNPTPVSQPDADWLWITSIAPSEVQLSRSVDVAWYLQYGTQTDTPVKSMRRNRTDETYGLWLSWEFALSGQATGFELPFWNGSVDALIRNPDQPPAEVAHRVVAGQDSARAT